MPGAPLKEPPDEEEGGEAEARPQDAFAEGLEALLERRLAVPRRVDEGRELAELGVLARRDDHRAPLAANEARPDEEHRRPVAERGIVGHHGARVLLHGDALAGEGALLDGQVDRLEQASASAGTASPASISRMSRPRRGVPPR